MGNGLAGEEWHKIGGGGFGNVYKVRHPKWGRVVAIKLMTDDGNLNGADVIREAELMQSGENRYVMKVLGYFRGCRPGEAFQKVGIIMDLMEKGSLASLQAKINHIPLPLVFRMVHQVAVGMRYLHDLEPALIHKDLKPANILLDENWSIKITDFGLSRFDNVITTIHAFTPFYTPPEYLVNLPGSATRAFDVYSYGMVVWSILNTGQNEKMTIRPVMGERPPLDHINGLQAEGLEKLVDLMKRCWSQRREDRPSFTQCTAVTQPLYEMHRPGIEGAISQVDTMLAPVPAGSTNREDYLNHSCALSLGRSSMNDELCLSEDNRMVTTAEQDQHHPENPDRFAHFPQVLSSERLPENRYFEVKWSGRYASLAVCYHDIDRNSEDNHASGFGGNDKSWMLYRSADRYWVKHNGIRTEVFETEVSSRVSGDDDEGGVFGVYVGHTAGTVSFYRVSGDRMSLLHTAQTDPTRPLYAGIHVVDKDTAEVCKIW